MMLFGEKYPDPVRMVSMGEFSRELCGGTHLNSTSDVGDFQITSEEGVAAGTRRIIALTGTKATDYISEIESLFSSTTDALAATGGNLTAVDNNGTNTELKKQLSNDVRIRSLPSHPWLLMKYR